MFNDGAFDAVRVKGRREENQIRLEHGQPIRFGAEGERGVIRGAGGELELTAVSEVGEDALLVHDAHRSDPGPGVRAGAPGRAAHRPHARRASSAPSSGRSTAQQFAKELEENRAEVGMEDLRALLHSGGAWTVG